ncbi:glycosyltransferase [Thermanaerothrix sp.]|uniref:glycosyltransferase n=1 Tax=Thermanaerothrix sp. TaxID=2972675 RepID=UPI003C7C9199
MRVALVMPSLEMGGVERVMLNLAGGLSQKGILVDLVVSDASGPLKNAIPNGVQLIDLKAPRVLRSIPGLVKYLRKCRPDAIISAKDYQNIVVLWAVKLAGIATNVIITTHIDVSVDWKQIKGLKSRIIPYLVRNCYPWADHVVTVSQRARDSLADITGLPMAKIKVIYNPVITPELLVKADEPLDHPWFALGEPPILLSVGRLTEQKDYLTLIRAFALVRKERPARLMILGDGEDRSKLEALVQELGLEEDVALPGFVHNPYNYMKRAAVFVLSSRWEGLPTVLIEAMACGCPVVSTDSPSGPAEILEGGKWGTLVPVGDADLLAKAIVQILERPPNREFLRKRGLEFSVDRAVQQYLALLSGGQAK